MPSWKSLFVHKRPSLPESEDYAHLNDGRYAKQERIVVQNYAVSPIHIGALPKAHSSSSSQYDHERPRTSSSVSSRYSPQAHAPRHRHQSGLSESHRSSSSTSVRFGDIMYERPRTPSYSTTTARYAKPPRSIMKPCPSLTSSWSDKFLHPLLVYPDAHLHYQLLQPPGPHSITVGSSGVPIPQLELAEPATHPPTRPPIQITNPHIPWTITVRRHQPSSHSFYVDGTQVPEFVSVYDVLHAIHMSLAKPISRKDWDTLPPQKQKSVTRAYERRCKAMGDDQWERGVRRIDWLRRRLVFGGLVATSDGRAWEAVLLEVGATSV